MRAAYLLVLAPLAATAQPAFDPVLTAEEVQACVQLERKMNAAMARIVAAEMLLERMLDRAAEMERVMATYRDTARVDAGARARYVRAEVGRDVALDEVNRIEADLRGAETARLTAETRFVAACEGRRYHPEDRARAEGE